MDLERIYANIDTDRPFARGLGLRRLVSVTPLHHTHATPENNYILTVFSTLHLGLDDLTIHCFRQTDLKASSPTFAPSGAEKISKPRIEGDWTT